MAAQVESLVPAALAARAAGPLARVRLRRRARASLVAALRLRTNLTHTEYQVPVRLYSGELDIVSTRFFFTLVSCKSLSSRQAGAMSCEKKKSNLP